MEVYNTEEGSIRGWRYISLSRGYWRMGVYITEQGSISEWGYH